MFFIIVAATVKIIAVKDMFVSALWSKNILTPKKKKKTQERLKQSLKRKTKNFPKGVEVIRF